MLDFPVSGSIYFLKWNWDFIRARFTFNIALVEACKTSVLAGSVYL